MSRYWSDLVHRLSPYVPGEQPHRPLVKLNTNENPYPPSPKVLAAVQRELGEAGESLRLYPEPTGLLLREAVARAQSLQPGQVFVGNSSDEVLAHVFAALLRHQDEDGRPRPLLFPDITYAFYPVWCGLYGIHHCVVPLDEQFGLVVDDYLQPDAGAVIFANPNAPTGRALPRAEVERLLQACPDKVVVIDEAYVDFGAESAVPLIDAYPNLLVVQTLSKSRSLAGLRAGYAMGQAHLVEALTRVKDCFNSYPLDRLALVGSAAAVDDREHFERSCQAVIGTRTRLTRSLRELGFDVIESSANFVFARHGVHRGAVLLSALRELGILVRRFDQPARIADFLRISVGTDAECEQLVQALRGWLEAHPLG